MTERNPHPDNDLIARLQEGGDTPSQGSRAGGTMQGNVGTRAELERALDDEEGTTSVVGSDNPGKDAMKGPKTIDALRSNGQG